MACWDETATERSTRYCSLAVHQHRSERKEEKDRNGRGRICLVGKNKKKGREGGTWVVGKKRKEKIKNKNKEMVYVGGEEKRKKIIIIIII
jgi:hypothetical protein